MGLQEAFLKTVNVQKLAEDAIKQLKPQDLVRLFLEGLKKEVALLKGDANKNGVVDGVEIEERLAKILHEGEEIAKLLALAHKE